jgi:hypothetical protein
MRKALLELCILVAGIVGIHTARIMRSGFINGKVYPANIAESVVAVNGGDSVKVISKNGYFGMRVEPGLWKVIVTARPKNNNVVRENLEVNEGQNINLGEIRLTE